MEKIFSSNSLKILCNAIGQKNLDFLIKSRVLFSSLIYCKDDYSKSSIYNLSPKIILKKKETPKLLEDWLVYLILRSICRTWVVSGQNLRDEKDIDILQNMNFYNFNDIEKYFYLGNNFAKFEHLEKITEEIISQYNHQRNLVILSKTLSIDEILNIKCFQENFAKKYLFTNPFIEKELKYSSHMEKLQEFLDRNHIYILEEKMINFENLIKIIKLKLENPLPILAEVGPTTFKNILIGKEGQNPIDFLLISVYNGEISNNCVGQDFPSLDEIESKNYKLINVSEKIQSEQGHLTFYTLVKRQLL
jgi:hypothetical protein